MNKLDLSILIVNYNTKGLLSLCLDSIYKNIPRHSFEIIVIDNSSADSNFDSIQKKYPSVKIFKNNSNEGFARANNRGLTLGEGRYYLLLNPDTIVLPGSIDSIITFMDEKHNNKIGILGPRLLGANHKIQNSCKKFPSLRGEFLQSTFLDKLLPRNFKSQLSDDIVTFKKTLEVDWITGACLAIRREVILDIGQFDENFFLYYEEVDLCYRAREKGWKVVFFPKARVIHYGGKSTEGNLTFSLIEGFKSKIYFLKKHYEPDKLADIRNFSICGAKIRFLIWLFASMFGFKKYEAVNRLKGYQQVLKIKKEPYIAIDITSVFRSRAGVGCYTKNLFNKLQARNSKNPGLVFAIKEKYKISQNKKRNPVSKSFSAAMHLFWEQLLIPLSLWRRSIELFHSPAYVCPLIKTCPTIITIHDMAYLLYPEKFVSTYRRYLKFWVPLCVRISDKIITDSICSKKDIMRLLGIPGEKIEVVYLGKDSNFKVVSDSALIEDFRIKYGLGKKFILYIGTLEPRKNITGLINAYYLFKKQNPESEYNLVIAGEKGWLYSSIFTLVENLGLKNSVIFMGYIKDKELPILYNAADLFVYPSLYEGFGLPVLEAMACGVPVITSNASSLPEIVGNAGIMVDPLDVQSLAISIQNVLLNEALRQKMIGKGLERAELFSWEKTAKETAQIYNKILNDHKK